MIERPILMNALSVSGILDGRKSKTRRLVKDSVPHNADNFVACGGGEFEPWRGDDVNWPNIRIKCRHGVVGDRLWVKETHYCCEIEGQGVGVPFLVYQDEFDKAEPRPEELRPWQFNTGKFPRWGCRPSIFMSRWASRLLLEIKAVHLERLQEITKEDVVDEGVLLPVKDVGIPGKVAPLTRISGKFPPAKYLPKEPTEDDFYKAEFASVWDGMHARPKPAHGRDNAGNKIIKHYVSYPWEDIQETRRHNGKAWHVLGNPWIFVIEFVRL